MFMNTNKYTVSTIFSTTYVFKSKPTTNYDVNVMFAALHMYVRIIDSHSLSSFQS